MEIGECQPRLGIVQQFGSHPRFGQQLRRAMLQSTFFFTADTLRGLTQMLKRDDLFWLWGKNGIYRNGFHPWQHDNLYLVELYREEFDSRANAA